MKRSLRNLTEYQILVAAQTTHHDDLIVAVGLATLIDPTSRRVRIVKGRWLA